MPLNGVVQRKLALLDKQVANLEERLQSVDQARFEADWGMRAMSERAVQVMAEIMIDVAERIIALKNAGPVATAADAMDRLVQLRVIAAADTYRQIVRFRNLIVHHYEEVDPALLYDIVRHGLNDVRRFRDEIDRWQTENDSLSGGEGKMKDIRQDEQD
jgi:uncharacterized protein YutE (UPF0331/DUF86 family)